jgi:hypothetical protein
MEWLIYLLYPLIMLLCMKRMFSGGKNCDPKRIQLRGFKFSPNRGKAITRAKVNERME